MTFARCGSVAIVGRTNVGKSTLLNALVEQKLSITAAKPQTTRFQVVGVRTDGDDQIVFVDTPGWQRNPHHRLGQLMNREMRRALGLIDIVLLVFDADHWDSVDAEILNMIDTSGLPVIALANKIDRLKDKTKLLPLIENLRMKARFHSIVPVSAKDGFNLDVLLKELRQLLPTRDHLFPVGQVTDRTERFLTAEIIREKLIRLLGDELPYSVSVIVDSFVETPECVHVRATIWVRRPNQKAIVIGQGGQMLKRVGIEARRDAERLMQRKVHLETWVKVRTRWPDDDDSLRQLGYG